MLEKIVVKMKRFNMSETKQLIKILHLNLEWIDITKLVAECRLRLSVPNVVSVVHEFLKRSELIQETYHRVLLVDTIYHQNSHWWTVSLDKVNKRLLDKLDKEKVRNNIQAMLDKLNIKGITYVMKYNQLFWVLINITETKNSKTGPKLNTPCFFTIAPGKVCHIFHKPQNIDKRLLKIVVKSIGANKSKPYALSGKHLPSMINLLEDKNKENVEKLELFDNYREEDVQDYVQKLFGNKRRILNQFTINVQSDMSVFSNTNPIGKMCKTKVELKGDNIIDGVKDMMLSGVLSPPYPSWVTQLPVLGKNCVDIEIRP